MSHPLAPRLSHPLLDIDLDVLPHCPPVSDSSDISMRPSRPSSTYRLAGCLSFPHQSNFQISLALASFRLASPTIHTSHCQSLLLFRRLELTYRHIDTTIRCLTASLSHLSLVCALGHARSSGTLDGHRQARGWDMRRGQPGKCRIVRQYHVHDCTMTGGRCADTTSPPHCLNTHLACGPSPIRRPRWPRMAETDRL